MTAQMIEYGRRTVFGKTIDQDMSICLDQNKIKIDKMIIEGTTAKMIIEETMIAQITTKGIVVTNTSVITHLVMIEMTDIHTTTED